MGSEKRKFKNVTLTGKYHWPYVGRWLVLNIFLVLLVEGFVLGSLHLVRNSDVSLPLTRYATVSTLVAVLIIAGLTVLATVWAHRIAGVHIRTENVFNRIASGDTNASLRYRSSDQLEDVEEAFDRMMESLAKTGRTDIQPPREETPEARERRSWKNVQMTSKYHFNYMAVWLLVSVGMLMACYASILFFLYLRHYLDASSNLSLTLLYTILTLITVLFAAVVIWRGFLTAHRLAGVHIKLIQTFDRVARGEGGVELRFRSYDKLGHLENAFQNMLESLQVAPDTEQVLDSPNE
jgi:methyl-accepting chemotaxis protein